MITFYVPCWTGRKSAGAHSASAYWLLGHILCGVPALPRSWIPQHKESLFPSLYLVLLTPSASHVVGASSQVRKGCVNALLFKSRVVWRVFLFISTGHQTTGQDGQEKWAQMLNRRGHSGRAFFLGPDQEAILSGRRMSLSRSLQ